MKTLSRVGWFLGLLLLLAPLAGVRAADPFEEAFNAALVAEEARRDLPAAIRGYEEVLARVEAQRRIAATAVFRLGECYRKLGRTNDAVAQYQRLLRDYPTEETLVRLSRGNLETLGEPAVTAPGNRPRLPDIVELDLSANAEAAEIKRLRSLFDRSPDLIQAVGTDGTTPLSRAVAAGQLEVVKALISWGVDIHRMATGETALHTAAKNGHRTVVEALIEAGADPNQLSKYGATPLSLAVGKGFEAVVETLLAKGALPGKESKSVSLEAAVKAGHTNLIARLVRAGADVSVRWPPQQLKLNDGVASVADLLGLAVAYEQRESSRMLVALGAKALTDDRAFHPLALLVGRLSGKSHADWVAELVHASAGYRELQALLDEALVIAATKSGEEDFVPALMKAGARIRTGAEPSANAFLVAAGNAWLLPLTQLIQSGADVNGADRAGTTALHVAAEKGLTNHVAALLKAGADPNRLDLADSTPLSRVQAVLNPDPTKPTSRFNGNRVQGLRAVESLLLAAGARTDVARVRAVTMRRGEMTSPIMRRMGDNPPPRLADALAMTIAQPGLQWAWPDLGAIRIHRWDPQTQSESVVAVSTNWTQSADCSWNLPLVWGDIVELPASDRLLSSQWTGLGSEVAGRLQECTARRVSLVVKNEAFSLDLFPARIADRNPNGGASISAVGVVGVSPDGSPVVQPPEPVINSVLLRTVLNQSGRLRSSSDLTRVKVTRPSQSKEWVLDVSTNESKGLVFWLLDGDRIEVPEKGP